MEVVTENEFCCLSCRSTRGHRVLDLGLQPLANNLLSEADLNREEPRFPLGIAVCESCWLVQLTHLVPPVELFSEYLYFSSFSETMLSHAAKAAEQYIRELGLKADSLVMEIASNDGYFLKNFLGAGIPVVGVEPAANIAVEAEKLGIPTEVEFFGADFAARYVAENRQADLILANNVFAHAPDTNDFVSGLAIAMSPDGVAKIEFPYLLNLLEGVEFDTIYHEHVFYFSVTALLPLFERHGLQIIDVEKIDIHGGSVRITIAHSGVAVADERVGRVLEEEREYGVQSFRTYEAFAERVDQLRHDLCLQLEELTANNHSIAAYGASAKGSTLLNYCGIGAETLQFVCDRSSYKQGKLTPGTHLPIVSAEQLLERMPDYTLLLTWNFAKEILEQQNSYREAGGKFVIPLPSVEVV